VKKKAMADDHRRLYKKTVDAEDLRKRREGVSQGLRRNQREENVQKRRQLATTPNPDGGASSSQGMIDEHEQAYSTVAQALVRACAALGGTWRAHLPTVRARTHTAKRAAARHGAGRPVGRPRPAARDDHQVPQAPLQR
jgi:hypothetical protein